MVVAAVKSPVLWLQRAPRLVVFVTVLVLPAVLTVRIIRGDTDGLAIIAGGSILVSLLTVVRVSMIEGRRPTRSDRVALLRLIAGFAVLVLLPLALMAEASIRLTERVVVGDAQARVRTTSTVSAQLVQRQMEGLGQLVAAYAERRLLAKSLGDGTLDTFDQVAVLRHLAQLQAATANLAGVFVTEASGRLGAVLPSTPAIVGKDFSFRDWYRGAITTTRPYISEAYTTSIPGGARVVAAASQVRDPDTGKVLGVLVAVYDLRAIQAFSEELSNAQGVSLRITDQRGTVVAAPGADGKALVDASGEVGVAQALQGQDSVEGADGEDILSAYAPVSGLGWTVTARVPTATAYASLEPVRSTVFAIAILLGQVLLGGLVLMARAQRQRQDAERRLLEREESMSGILEAAADAFVAIDVAGDVTYWSGQAEQLFGWASEQACGSSLAELIIPDSMRQRHSTAVARLADSGVSTIPGQRIEVSAIHRDGTEFPVELVIWQSGVGGTLSFNAFIHDISDRKQYEAQLAAARDGALEASRVKTEFLAVMSHELRTPMNGVMGMTSLLLGTTLSTQQRDYAETVRTSADRLLGLLNDVLDLAKVEADRLELEVLDFDLNQLVHDIVQFLEAAAERKGIALTSAIDDDVRRALRGDPARVRQVLLNLVGNAVKFTATGSVHLRVLADTSVDPAAGSTEQLRLRFEITDTGIGIAPEARGRLFESFSQADASTTRRYGGTGLGLAISKSLVALFNGEIGVESQFGAGSTFWFTAQFLAGGAGVAATQAEAVAAVEPSAAPGLVLVVDDIAINQKVAVRMLESLGHRADVAADGAEAVEAWARVPYDLILMDCRMPVMDGYEATQAIRAAEGSGRRIPIVAMTASAMTADRQKCLDAGMDDFLSKPVQLSDVRRKVNHWLPRTSPTTGPAQNAPVAMEDEAERLPILDSDIIAELRSLGEDFLISLAEVFVAAVPDRLAEIRAAVQSGDTEGLSVSAHALRGSAANMGGARVASVCARLEEAGFAGQLAETGPDLVLLEVETALLVKAMVALIDVAV